MADERTTADERFQRETRDLIVSQGLMFISALMDPRPEISGPAHAILILADWEVGDAVHAHLADWEG